MSGSMHYLVGLLISILFPWRRVFGFSSGRVSSEYRLRSFAEKKPLRKFQMLVKHHISYALERFFCFRCDILVLSGNLGSRLLASESKTIPFSTFTAGNDLKSLGDSIFAKGDLANSTSSSSNSEDNYAQGVGHVVEEGGPVFDIGFIGRFDHPKGADLFIDTIECIIRLSSEASQPGPKFSVSVVGRIDLSYQSALERIADSCELKVYGEVGAVKAREIAVSLDLLLFPSRDEGMPRAPLEVMRGGGIVVAQRTGADFYITDGHNGILVNQWSAAAVAAHTFNIMQNYKQFSELRKRAIETSREMFLYNRVVFQRRLASLMESVM